MGTLAKLAIAQGKKVPLGTIPAMPELISQQQTANFSERALGELGFAGIASKIQQGEDLSLSEIEQLLAQAPLAALLKCVELRQHSAAALARPVPVVVFPFDDWILHRDLNYIYQSASSYLCSIPCKSVQVYFEGFDPALHNEDWGDFFSRLSSCRPGVTLVAPALEAIIETLIYRCGVHAHELGRRVESLLHELRLIGFHRLRASAARSFISILDKVGFPKIVRMELNHFASLREVAAELLKLHTVSSSSAHGTIEAWMPTVSPEIIGSGIPQAAIDLLVLRTLAVGTLVLRRIPRHRVCSITLSLESIRFSRFCGANDFGFGAFDRETEGVLRLKPFSDLEQVYVQQHLHALR